MRTRRDTNENRRQRSPRATSTARATIRRAVGNVVSLFTPGANRRPQSARRSA